LKKFKKTFVLDLKITNSKIQSRRF